jgi:two-component system chemotaxis response regulator CheY
MPKTVLAVDDSQTMRDMVSFTLRNAGFDVKLAVDGKDALSKLDGSSIDLVITDINMPNMNGIELTRQIRSMPAYKATPILILTTESDGARKAEGKAAGATGWIVKPFDPDKLIQVVNKVCP